MYNSGNSSKNVTGASVVDGTLYTVDIADDAVTADKLANTVNADIATGVSGSTTAGDALPKSGGAMTGAITTNSTFDGVDVATRDGILTSTTSTANAALPKAGGALTGAVTTNSTFDGVDVATRDGVLTTTTSTADAALPKAGGTMTGTLTGKKIISGGITGTASPTQYANSGITVDDGAATSTYGFAHKGAGRYLRIGLPNASFAYFETDANAGFNFNDDVRATAHLVTSDYRLKENVVPMVGSIDRLKQLKPSRFNFIKEPLITVDGFLAHEAGNVIPECASGTKDAMIDEEYEITPAVMDGDTVVTEAVMGTRSVPVYQGIDQAKIVPLLVASLQEAVTKIEALEARVTALETP